MKINDLQRVLLNTYEGGRWAHIMRSDDYRDCDDMLFKAAFEQLGDDCIIEAHDKGLPVAVIAGARLGRMIASLNSLIPSVYDGRVVINMEPPKSEPLIAATPMAPEPAHA